MEHTMSDACTCLLVQPPTRFTIRSIGVKHVIGIQFSSRPKACLGGSHFSFICNRRDHGVPMHVQVVQKIAFGLRAAEVEPGGISDADVGIASATQTRCCCICCRFHYRVELAVVAEGARSIALQKRRRERSAPERVRRLLHAHTLPTGTTLTGSILRCEF